MRVFKCHQLSKTISQCLYLKYCNKLRHTLCTNSPTNASDSSIFHPNWQTLALLSVPDLSLLCKALRFRYKSNAITKHLGMNQVNLLLKLVHKLARRRESVVDSTSFLLEWLSLMYSLFLSRMSSASARTVLTVCRNREHEVRFKTQF